MAAFWGHGWLGSVGWSVCPHTSAWKDQVRARDGRRREVGARAGTESNELRKLILNVAFWVVMKVYSSTKKMHFI